MQHLLAGINSVRAGVGVGPVTLDPVVSLVAQTWALVMATAGEISHNPDVGSQLNGIIAVAENVGRGPSLDWIHNGLINSPSHYKNMVNPNYTVVGLGVLTLGSQTWVVEDFVRPLGGPVSTPPPVVSPGRGRSRPRSRRGPDDHPADDRGACGDCHRSSSAGPARHRPGGCSRGAVAVGVARDGARRSQHARPTQRVKAVGSCVVTRPIRVMVVDDTDHVRRMLTSMLSLDGFVVVGEASGGSQAVAGVDEADPDVVVIDYKMPGMDGLDTARNIRAGRPDQVMILYTAYVDEDLQRQAEEAGIALCLGKVEGLDSLEREISRLCSSLF